MTSKTLAKKIAQSALSKKAYDVVLLDLRKLTSMTDYFVVCSVDSDTQARAVADAVKNDILEKGDTPARKEGYSEGRWILLDYVDVVIHIFNKDIRTFYNLEKLWGDAPFEHIDDRPVKRISSPKKKPASKPTRRKKTQKK